MMDYIANNNEISELEIKINDIKLSIKNVKSEIVNKNTELTNLQYKYESYQKVLNEKKKHEIEMRKKEFYKKSFNAQIKLGESPLFTEMESNEEYNLIEFLEDNIIKNQNIDPEVDEIIQVEDVHNAKELNISYKFGDVIDGNRYRHYGFSFIGKNGEFVNTSRETAIDQEYGVTVPLEITRYLIDSLAKYKNNENACICAIEVPYYDINVQKYDVPKNVLYEFRKFYEGTCEFMDDWELWVIDDSKEWKAEFIDKKIKEKVEEEILLTEKNLNELLTKKKEILGRLEVSC